jgi:hypothetical protein
MLVMAAEDTSPQLAKSDEVNPKPTINFRQKLEMVCAYRR